MNRVSHPFSDVDALLEGFKPIRKPEQLLRTDETVTAKVAFSRRIARWLKERYPDGREGETGGTWSRSRSLMLRGSCGR